MNCIDCSIQFLLFENLVRVTNYSISATSKELLSVHSLQVDFSSINSVEKHVRR